MVACSLLRASVSYVNVEKILEKIVLTFESPHVCSTGFGDDAVSKSFFALKQRAPVHQQFREIPRAKCTINNRPHKWSPQLLTRIAEADEISRRALTDGVPNNAAKARPDPFAIFLVLFIGVVNVRIYGCEEDRRRG